MSCRHGFARAMPIASSLPAKAAIICYMKLKVCSKIAQNIQTFLIAQTAIWIETACRLSRPVAQQFACLHELSEMIGVVVSRKQQFAQVSMPFPVRNLCRQIGAFIRCQIDQSFEISRKSPHRLIPPLVRDFVNRRWPVTSRPLGRLPIGVERISQNVLLGEAQVLQLFPDGMPPFGGAHVTLLRVDAFQGGLRLDVRRAVTQ